MAQNLDFLSRQGGDVVSEQGRSGRDTLAYFLRANPIWESDSASTIFRMYPSLVPLLRFQPDKSMTCAPIVAALTLHYAQQCRRLRQSTVGITNQQQQFLDDKEHPRRFALNVARFIRTKFNKEQLAQFIFPSHLTFGLDLRDMVARVLQLRPGHEQRTEDDVLGSFRFFTSMVESWAANRSVSSKHADTVYTNCQEYLKDGPFFMFLKICSEYNKSDFIKLEDFFREKHEDMPQHSVMIVGVVRTPDKNGGVLFLVQDSDPDFPFKNVGLDVLLEMNIIKLSFIEGTEDLEIECDDYEKLMDIDPYETSYTTTGSPQASVFSRLMELLQENLACDPSPHALTPAEKKELRRQRALSRYCWDRNYTYDPKDFE